MPFDAPVITAILPLSFPFFISVPVLNNQRTRSILECARTYPLFTGNPAIAGSPHSKALSVQRVRETRKLIPLACSFEQEPSTTLGFIEPYFDETRRRDIPVFVTDVVRFAEARSHRFVVVHQFREHVQWLDVFGIVIGDALGPRDLSDRMQRESADFANPLRNDVRHGKELFSVFVEK